MIKEVKVKSSKTPGAPPKLRFRDESARPRSTPPTARIRCRSEHLPWVPRFGEGRVADVQPKPWRRSCAKGLPETRGRKCSQLPTSP